MVLCMLAVAILSISALSIVRSHRRINARAMAVGDQARGIAVAEGLLHRHVALARHSGGVVLPQTDPGLAGTVHADAVAILAYPDPARINVRVNLFPRSTPAVPSLMVGEAWITP